MGEIVDRSRKAAAEEYLPEGNRYREMIAAEMAGGAADSLYQLRRSYVREKRECPTLTANMGTGGHNVPFVKDRWGIRRLSIAEVAQLQGFEPGEDLFPEGTPSNEQYRLLGNAVCPKLAKLVGERCHEALLELEDGS